MQHLMGKADAFCGAVFSCPEKNILFILFYFKILFHFFILSYFSFFYFILYYIIYFILSQCSSIGTL